MIEADGGSVDHAKIAVKGIIGLVVLALVMANLRKERIATGLWALLLAADRRQHLRRGVLGVRAHLIPDLRSGPAS